VAVDNVDENLTPVLLTAMNTCLTSHLLVLSLGLGLGLGLVTAGLHYNTG